jgi:small subunit ribosomal protein S9
MDNQELKSVQKKEVYHQGTGRRKKAIASARVFNVAVKGLEITINTKRMEVFFPVEELRDTVVAPLKLVGKNDLRIDISVKGGGIRGQAEAIRLAISRSLVKMDENFRKPLKDIGYLTRDQRKVERKKPGLRKARRAPQFSKR